MVLFDQGVSRRHARILEKEGRYFVEDLGSANGTKLNGSVTSGVTELQSGDSIGLGPVVFAFGLLEEAAPEPAGQETRIVNRASVAASPRRSAGHPAPVPAPVAVAVAATPASAAAAALPPEPDEELDEELEEERTDRSGKLARSERPMLSAAERARLRRQAGNSLGGQLRYAWSQLSGKKKTAALGTIALVLVAAVGGLLGLFGAGGGVGGLGGREPDRLSLQPIEGSFGLGGNVRWTRPDMKVFGFEFTAPTRAVVVLHYQAQDISENEVSVILNAVDQGFVPPDVAGAPEREIEQVLSPAALKRNQKNQLIFDNVKNPPGRETWRVQGLWMEVVPIPEVAPTETIANAQEYARRAAHFYDLREVGPENLFRAWKSYRDAWLALESLDQKPELYQTVRFQMNALKHQLDQQCARLMLEAERSIQLNDPARAAQTLEDVSRYFPTREHGCHNLALQKMAELDR